MMINILFFEKIFYRLATLNFARDLDLGARGQLVQEAVAVESALLLELA